MTLANSAVGGGAASQGQLAQGLSFSISPMKTNRPLYGSAWPLGPLKAGAYLQTSCKSLLLP